jgi:predicted DNA repair protein MutK
MHAIPAIGAILGWLAPLLFDFLFGIAAGAAVIAAIHLYKIVFGGSHEP